MPTQVEPVTSGLVPQEENISEMRRYSKVLDSARELPEVLQIMLAQQLLTELTEREPVDRQEIVELRESLPPRAAQRQRNIAALRERVHTRPRSNQPPTDAEIEQWQEEHRLERYG